MKQETQSSSSSDRLLPPNLINTSSGRQMYSKESFYIGLGLAVISSLFIGSSFILKKLSLSRLNKTGGLRAGAGGFGYLRDWMWWCGFLTMGVGELANFAAYAFAPASLVTPLGALSVIVSAVLSARFLGEKLHRLGKLGCVLCILGSIIIVIHSPKEEEVETVRELFDKLRDATFINYLFIILAVTLIIIFYVGPRYGSRHVLVYVSLCSAVGSVTVMACKGLGLSIREAFYKNTSISSSSVNIWLSCLLFFVTVIVCVCLQMNYLNKALDLFDASLVTPVYYVMFTTLVIIASAILFKEWIRMGSDDVLGNICGFLVVIVAIFLLQSYRDVTGDGMSSSDYFKQNQCLLKNSARNNYGVNYLLTRTV